MRNNKTFWVALLLFGSVGSAVSQPPDSLWSRTYGGDLYDECRAILQTTDGGFLLAGQTSELDSTPQIADCWLLKTDANGDCVWNHRIETTGLEHPYDLIPCYDGTFVVAGNDRASSAFANDFWLLKVDSMGDTVWDRTYGGPGVDACEAVLQTPDSGFVLGGWTESFGAGGKDFWLVRTDSDGDSLWSRTFGGSWAEECHDIVLTSDGGYLLVGEVLDPVSSYDIWIVKTDTNGDSEWSRTYGGFHEEYCLSAAQSADGGYVLAGYFHSLYTANEDALIIRTDADGDTLWTRMFPRPPELQDWCEALCRMPDGSSVLAGCRGVNISDDYGGDFWLFKVSSAGDSVWSRVFDTGSVEWCFGLKPTADGGFVMVGTKQPTWPDLPDVWLVRIGPTSSVPAVSVPARLTLLTSYPNPFNSTTQIAFMLPVTQRVSLRLYDVLGREVAVMMSEIQTAGKHEMMFDASGLPSGVYLCRLEAGRMMQTRKMVLIR